MYYHYLCTQLHLPGGSVIVWTKSHARYMDMSTDIVCMYLCIFALVCLIYIYIFQIGDHSWSSFWFFNKQHYLSIYISTICLLNSACLVGVCLCGRSRVLDIYIYMSIGISIYSCILALVRLNYVYIWHYLSTQLCLPAENVIVWTKSRVRCIYVHVWILSLPYKHIVTIWHLYVCLIYIYIYIATIRECPKIGLDVWIWANVISVEMAVTAVKRDERKTRFSWVISVT